MLKKSKSLNGSVDEENEEMSKDGAANKSSGSLTTHDDSFESVIDSAIQYEKLNCFYLYKKYIKEIYVRMKQFKDELLASCLEFMLSLPKELIILNLNEAFEALQVI